MVAINSWIKFNGNAGKFLMFYKFVFGGEFGKVVGFQDNAGGEFSTDK